MKKIIFGLVALIVIILIYEKEEVIFIPDSSIRIRVISNSNNLDDLYQKKVIKSKLENYLYSKLENVDSISDARIVIENSVSDVKSIIEANNISKYNINYGLNYFPKKIYKGIVYPEGDYEPLEVMIGDGVGDNYWCVLFPPLCLINENQLTDDVSYQLYVKELLKIDK